MTATTQPEPAKVLVIDDDLGPRESLRILLKNQYRVFCADSVDAGLLLLRQHAPDVIIMDIRMPGKTGIDGLREIRQVDAQVSVIMLTGFGTLETAQEAIRLGANDYLKKPFDMRNMEEVIQRNVQRTGIERRRQSTARELHELNRRLLQEVARKDHLASMGQRSAEYAHDLRNPLQAVIGYVDILSDSLRNSIPKDDVSWPETLESLEMIEVNSRRCKEMTDMWTNMGHMDDKPRQPVPMHAFLKEVLKSIEPRAAKQKVELRFQATGGGGSVSLHKLQMFRALANVIVNALEALNQPGGLIDVTLRHAKDRMEIEVKDNGCGIEPDKLASVFDPYFTTKPVTGTGLGLFITKTVIEDHGGGIEIQSQKDSGTTVTIRLPLSPAAV